LQETLHNHNQNGRLHDDSFEALETASCGSNANEMKQKAEEQKPKESLMKNWPLMSSIIVYCVFSLHDMAYTEVNFIQFYVNKGLILIAAFNQNICWSCYICIYDSLDFSGRLHDMVSTSVENLTAKKKKRMKTTYWCYCISLLA
jgi:hypothetical protein